ncbi:hypothetical protein GLPA100918_10990 [Glaesserella parasuis]
MLPSLDTTSVAAAFTVSFNCFTFTASVSFLPSATLLITLPPLSKPLAVSLTSDFLSPALVGFLMVIPLSFIVVLPVVTEPSVPKSMFFANFTFNTPFSAITPILLSLNLVVSAPPLISSLSFNFFAITFSSALSPSAAL